jgi:hypothetical protein
VVVVLRWNTNVLIHAKYLLLLHCTEKMKMASRDGANRWVDNIFSMQGWMKKKFVGMEKQINQLFVQVSTTVITSLCSRGMRVYYFLLHAVMQEGVPVDMDYIE